MASGLRRIKNNLMYDNPPLLFLFMSFVLVISYLFLRVKEEKVLGSNSQRTSKSRNIPQLPLEEAYQKVNAFLAQKDHRSAQEYSLRYLEADPSFHELRELLVKSYIDTKKDYDAIAHLAILVKAKPDDDKLALKLALLYQNTRQNKKAIELYAKLVRKDNTNIMAMRNLGALYMSERQKDAALKIYKQLVNNFDDEKDKAEFFAPMADIYANQGENAMALDLYKKAFAYYPTNADILKNCRKVYARMKDLNNLLRLCKKLITMEPLNYDLYKDIIELLLNMKKYDEALEYAQKASQLSTKDDKSLKNMIAKIYTYTNRADEAIEMIKNQMQYDPSDLDMVQTYAMAYCMDKKYPEAVKVCLDAIELAMPSGVLKLQNAISNILAEQAVELLNEGSNAEAFDKFTEALQYNSENPEIYYKLCEANRKIKNYSEAIKQCKRAIEIAPENSKYYVFLGDIYLDLQNEIESKKQYKEAVNIDPKNAQAHTKLGIMQAKDKEYELAIKSLRTALTFDENNADIKYNLALVYELSGDIEEAKIEYKKVLSIDPNHEETINNLQILGG